MFAVKVYEQAEGFTAMSADELFFINGGSGSTPQLDAYMESHPNPSSESKSSSSNEESKPSGSFNATAEAGYNSQNGPYAKVSVELKFTW